VGVNGFGRIGRCVAKQVAAHDQMDLVAINDVADNVDNLLYLYNYDSHYGRANPRAERIGSTNTCRIGRHDVEVFRQANVADAEWQRLEVDLLVDSSGITDNVTGCQKLVASGSVRKAVITHSPDNDVDAYVIMGVNDDTYDSAHHHVVSNTICDANAIAHVLLALDEQFGITRGMVTTLHPWLSFQNLVDGPVPWQARPGAYWSDFSLGRSSVNAMIPKNTTVISALQPVLPTIPPRFSALSYRVPTQVVCSADLTVDVREPTDRDGLLQFFNDRFDGSPYVTIDDESLVSTDFVGQSQSASIDARWLNVVDERMLKVVLWYDNEWGYSSRVVDLLSMIGDQLD